MVMKPKPKGKPRPTGKTRVPFKRNRSSRDTVRGALLRGEAVDVPCLLRRTSARGWGPWTDAIIRVPEMTGTDVSWHVEDPVAVGQPVLRGSVDEYFTEIEHLGLRAVRFKSEAFWGIDAEIMVLTAERDTTELAFPIPVTEPVAQRLQAHLGRPGGH